MKHLFLVNPASGKHDMSQMVRSAVEASCKGLDYEIKVSRKAGDIKAWAREAAETGEALRIYACGGDGTLNEVVNGAVGHPNVAITHFPGGSGNDFIKIFSDAAPFRDLNQLLEDPREAEFDLICCNGAYAMNSCSMGLDARIGTEVVSYKRLPLVSGTGAYLLSVAANVVKGIHRHYRVTVNGETIDSDLTLIYVGSGRWYGGSFNPMPDGDPTDGMLEVLLVQPVSRLTVAKVIGPYQKGQYAQYPELIRMVRTKSITVEADAPEAIQMDGEKHVHKVAEFTLAPCKMRFFYPRSVTWQALVPAGK